MHFNASYEQPRAGVGGGRENGACAILLSRYSPLNRMTIQQVLDQSKHKRRVSGEVGQKKNAIKNRRRINTRTHTQDRRGRLGYVHIHSFRLELKSKHGVKNGLVWCVCESVCD